MYIVVIGTAGFIAARVVEFLLADGHHVLGIDNLNDAYDVRLKIWRLNRLRAHPKFTFLRCDITDFEVLRRILGRTPTAEAKPPSALINLAARAGVRRSAENPEVYFQTNVSGTLNLLEAAREFGIKKFLLASTSSLYGEGNPMPYREDSSTDKPLSPYAASKKAAEALCYSYHYLHGIDVTVLRYFSVYGPAGRPDMSPFRFVQWITEERPVTIYGDGSQKRDFIFVDDIARGTIAALKPIGYEVINLGSDEPIALDGVIQLVEEMVEKKAVLVHKPPHPADVHATWADISKAERLLDWRPETTFVHGIANLVEWYRKNRSWTSTIRTD